MIGKGGASRWKAVVLAVIIQGLTGCATPAWLCLAPPGPHRLTLIADPNANGDTAVAVDLVFISNQVVADQVAPLSAQEYFSRRDQLERDFPGGMQVSSWELAPGQIARDQPVNATCNRVRTLLFARYATPGDHRQTLNGAKDIIVWLNQADFAITP
jgi:type VI secretion system protein